MSLAAPAFLAALSLLVPVLIAFLVRRRRRVLRVPSTMIWRLGARSVAKSRRIRDVRRLIALLACLLGVAALVVAAARPAGKRSDTIVFVVDVSASMSGDSWKDARAWLLREVAGLGTRGRVAVVLAGAEARVVLPPSPPSPLVDEALASIAIEKSGAAMEEAIRLAEGLASGDDARVVVLSDRPVESLPIDTLDKRPRAEMRIFAHRSLDNLGITSLFSTASPDARDDEEREAAISIATSSAHTRRARIVLRLGDRVVADRRLDVPAQGEVTERVGLRGSGRLVARVVPDDGLSDVLAIDDEASLEEVARRPPRVALVRVKDEGSAGFFVERALRAAGVTEIVEVDPDGPAPKNVDLAIVLRDGSGRPADIPVFLIGVEPEALGMTTRSVGRSEARLRSVASEDPLLRGVALDELTTLRAKVVTTMPEGARTLVDLDGGPVVVAGGAGLRSWVWLGIDPQASDLVLRVAFPVLVGNVLAQLGGPGRVVTAKTVPRSEVILTPVANGTPLLATAPEPRWRLPAAPSIAIAMCGALLLAIEAWLTFRRRWAA